MNTIYNFFKQLFTSYNIVIDGLISSSLDKDPISVYCYDYLDGSKRRCMLIYDSIKVVYYKRLYTPYMHEAGYDVYVYDLSGELIHCHSVSYNRGSNVLSYGAYGYSNISRSVRNKLVGACGDYLIDG